jgi:hypothetical protein
MQWKAYRIIFKVNFKIDFRLLNLLGHLANDMVSISESEKEHVNRDITIGIRENQNLTIRCNLQKESFIILLGFQSVEVNIEIKDGIEIENIIDLYSIKLLDILREKIVEKDIKINDFKIVGFRAFCLAKQDKKFSDVVEEYRKNLLSIIPNIDYELFDAGVIFDFKKADEKFIQIKSGPYQEDEYKKYFESKPNVKSGLIADIDNRDLYFSLKHYTFKNMINERTKQLKDILKKVWCPKWN